MKRLLALVAVWLICLSFALAQHEPGTVIVNDRGVQTRTVGAGAPAHTIGLTQLDHQVDVDTGKTSYLLRYAACRDPKNPQGAVPGEGYIGMPGPVSCNWYHGGFFDLEINGQSIGKTMLHSLTVRSVADRGFADFVFDTPMAVVRVRFVGKAGGDCLYAQALLESKTEVKSLRLITRCYPSAFVSNADRHVTTVTRDLKQGEKAELDLATEFWTLYYDSVYDAGHIGTTYVGAGPCAMLWVPSQTEKAGFSVASYGIDTVFTLKPSLKDFRFIFWDFKGTRNAEATASVRGRAEGMLKELAAFEFTDPSLANWKLADKQAELQKMLALVPEDKVTAARYADWSKKLEEQLQLVRNVGAGSVMAEAEAARLIGEWERGLPELKLQALINEF